MVQQKFCEGCGQAHKCQEVYEELGHAGGPSIARKTLVAFLLPILVFIAGLAIFEGILAGLEIAADLRTVLGLAASLLVTVVFVLIIRASNPPNRFGG